jgi:hypothetical protein
MKNKRIVLISFIIFASILVGRGINAQEKKVVPEPKKSMGVATTGITPTAFVGGTAWTISEGKSTRLILKKLFKVESVSKESEFEMEKDQRRFKVAISGWCRSGEIHVIIIRPSGEEYKTLVIDSSAEVEWSQSVRFADEDKDYTGKWIVQIVAKEADGLYNVMLSAD